MPMGPRCGPATCAENMAASPKTAMRPRPNGMAAPCDSPFPGAVGVVASNCQATRGSSTVVPAPSVMSARPGAATRKACPVNATTESTRSAVVRPSVIGCDAREPSARLYLMMLFVRVES